MGVTSADNLVSGDDLAQPRRAHMAGSPGGWTTTISLARWLSSLPNSPTAMPFAVSPCQVGACRQGPQHAADTVQSPSTPGRGKACLSAITRPGHIVHSCYMHLNVPHICACDAVSL